MYIATTTRNKDSKQEKRQLAEKLLHVVIYDEILMICGMIAIIIEILYYDIYIKI